MKMLVGLAVNRASIKNDCAILQKDSRGTGSSNTFAFDEERTEKRASRKPQEEIVVPFWGLSDRKQLSKCHVATILTKYH